MFRWLHSSVSTWALVVQCFSLFSLCHRLLSSVAAAPGSARILRAVTVQTPKHPALRVRRYIIFIDFQATNMVDYFQLLYRGNRRHKALHPASVRSRNRFPSISGLKHNNGTLKYSEASVERRPVYTSVWCKTGCTQREQSDIIKRNIAAFYPPMPRCSWETERILQGNILSSGPNGAKSEGGAGGWWKYGAMHLCITAGFHEREARICCKTKTGCICYRSECGMCFYVASVYQFICSNCGRNVSHSGLIVSQKALIIWREVVSKWRPFFNDNNNNVQQKILRYQRKIGIWIICGNNLFDIWRGCTGRTRARIIKKKQLETWQEENAAKTTLLSKLDEAAL